MNRAQILRLADRAQRMSGDAHRRGDFLAAERLLMTARRYRRLALEVRS